MSSPLTALACRLAAIRIEARQWQRMQQAEVVRRGTPVFGAGHRIIGNIGEDGVFHPAGEGKAAIANIRAAKAVYQRIVANEKAQGRPVTPEMKAQIKAYNNEIARYRKGDFSAPARTKPPEGETPQQAHIRTLTESYQHTYYQSHAAHLADPMERFTSQKRQYEARVENDRARASLQAKPATPQPSAPKAPRKTAGEKAAEESLAKSDDPQHYLDLAKEARKTSTAHLRAMNKITDTESPLYNAHRLLRREYGGLATWNRFLAKQLKLTGSPTYAKDVAEARKAIDGVHARIKDLEESLAYYAPRATPIPRTSATKSSGAKATSGGKKSGAGKAQTTADPLNTRILPSSFLVQPIRPVENYNADPSKPHDTRFLYHVYGGRQFLTVLRSLTLPELRRSAKLLEDETGQKAPGKTRADVIRWILAQVVKDDAGRKEVDTALSELNQRATTPDLTRLALRLADVQTQVARLRREGVEG